MKTKIRHKNNSEEVLSNINPALLWGLVVSFFYSIFWWVLIENYQTLYIAWLFLIFPVFYTGYTWIQKLKNILSKNAFNYAIALIINIFILTLYICTLNGVYLSLFLFFSILLAFINYIPYLEIKYQKRIIKNKQQAKYKSIFNTLLKDKNFLHHHNYYNDPKLRWIYKREQKKENFKNFIISTSIIPIFILLWWIKSLLNWDISLLGYIWIFFIIFWIVATAKFLAYVIRVVLGKSTWSKTSMYQKKIGVDSYIKYRKKLFFY